MQWRAYVRGSDHDLELLERHLAPGSPLSFGRDQYGAFLTGEDLQVAEAQDVPNLSKRAVARANAIMRLAADNFGFIEGTGSHVAENGAQTISLDYRVTDPVPDPYEAPTGQAAAAVEKKTARSHLVTEALGLLGRTSVLDWVVLYKIYELLEADAGSSSQLRARGNVTKRQANAFTGSANLRSVSGWAARHGVDDGSVPQDTMTLDEARVFILGLLRRW